jgi:Lrp/AsnC family transcriptional regulator for asnA, asnC and gidA
MQDVTKERDRKIGRFMLPNGFQPDDLDISILKMLMHNANTPYTDIARELNVSGGTIHVRMKKMQEAGIVQGARLIVRPSSLGFDITAFLGIYLERASVYKEVQEMLESIPEVVELHYTTGAYNMFAKIICKNTEHLREVLHDKLQRVSGVQRTETLISLEEGISREIQLD